MGMEFMWIPVHCGTLGNEKMNPLAKEVASNRKSVCIRLPFGFVQCGVKTECGGATLV